MLQKQSISVPLAKGIDNKTDNKQQAIGELVLLEEIAFLPPLMN